MTTSTNQNELVNAEVQQETKQQQETKRKSGGKACFVKAKAKDKERARITKQTRLALDAELCSPFKVLNAIKAVAKTDEGLLQLLTDLGLKARDLRLEDFGRFCISDNEGRKAIYLKVSENVATKNVDTSVKVGDVWYMRAEFKPSAYIAALVSLRADKRREEKEKAKAERANKVKAESKALSRDVFINTLRNSLLLMNDKLTAGEAEAQAVKAWNLSQNKAKAEKNETQEHPAGSFE